MRFWSGIVVTLSVLLSFVAAPATASAAGCKANVSPATVDKTAHYYGGNEYMGPIDSLFPTGPAGKLLGGYNRLGDEIPTTGNPDTDTNTFLAKYRTPDGKNWDYPPNWGFDSHGSTRTTLTVGMEIDRFGYDGGSFLSPRGVAFRARALPPDNLDSPGGTPEANYHVYCVVKPFDVDQGGIAPAFGQPGGGIQDWLNPDHSPVAASRTLAVYSAKWLITNKYLVEEMP